MSNTKMLIDATHPEETRVVVQRNGRVEEFDFESAARKLLRGNIYLAKVTRVEPSLQAAFVDYGGNRHGFLAFNEIHPDYYQIPVADRQALIDEEAAAEAELEAAADRRAEALARRSHGRLSETSPDHVASIDSEDSEASSDDAAEASHIIDVEEDEHIEEVGGDADSGDAPQTFAAAVERGTDIVSEPYALPLNVSEHAADSAPSTELPAHDDAAHDDNGHNDDDDDHNEAAPSPDSDDDDADSDAGSESAGDYDAEDTSGHNADNQDEAAEAPHSSGTRGRKSSEFGEDSNARPRRRPRSYKIQEVIKRRQVILVQVVKEERGNKGAALTTYLSLAGRYTVLMPNTARGGGISRKITNPQDRKRLKSIANELEVPEGMGLIIRTAGAARTKQEIKRDFEYLLRLWESVRDLTLQSTAPSLVYEEGDLIKRSIRDLYNKDVEEVVVAGDAGYDEAAAFMRMLMPSHSKHVVPYKNPTPLFTSYGVERQLNAMFLPQVTLRSGGYIVINQTEALVAIDVNSGKSTREFSIEETAQATNLEAADEIARQLKLRDLAGLIVIDFIDMEEKRNNRAVERRLKDALRFDRARIQLGRISHFGLMEMSRQRLRTGVLEGSTSQCAHCQGTGIIRSTESIALAVLRGLEDAITAGAATPLIATTTPTVALYILNSKRAYVTDMELRHGFSVTIIGSERIQGANFTVERGAPSSLPLRRPERAAVNMDWGFEGEGEAQDAPEFLGAEIEQIAGPDEDDDPIERHARGENRGGEGRGNESRGDGEARDGEDDGSRKGGRRRRRRGRGRGPRDTETDRNDLRTNREKSLSIDDAAGDPADVTNDDAAADDQSPDESGPSELNDHVATGADEGATDRPGRRRRRGRRGGRRGREGNGGQREHTASDPGETSSEEGQSFNGEPANGEIGQPHAQPRAITAEPGQPYRQTRDERANPRNDRPRPERIWNTPAASVTNASRSEPRPPQSVAPGSDAQRVTAPPAPAVLPPSPPPMTSPEPASTPMTAQPASQIGGDLASSKRRHEGDSSEPRIERVVVSPDHPGSANDDVAAQPQRKGWWQRRFGGE